MATSTRGTRHPLVHLLMWALVAVVLLAVVAGGLGWWTVQRSFPQTSGEIDIPGLSAPVTVERDEQGVPTITATTASDLFLAQGYVQAQDRFWEMDFRRHVTSGRLAELFGESQVPTDAFIRTLGWRNVAEQEVEALDETTLGYYQSYADGVNAYLATHAGADISLEYAVLGLQNPGYEPEEWTPADSVSWLKAMAWDLRSNLEQEIDRALLSTTLSSEDVATLYPGYDYGTNPVIVSSPGTASVGSDDEPSVSDAPLDEASGALESLAALLDGIPSLLGQAGSDIGSNAWVVSGDHTETGMPLLANDPHLGPAMPSVWYQMGLRCETVGDECPFDVAGYTFSGLPGVVIGHNDAIAWGFTNLGPDVADLYIEKVDEDAGTYELDGEQVEFALREETIRVAGGDDVTITVRSTGRGPIVSDATSGFSDIAEDYPAAIGQEEGDFAVSLQWTALEPGSTAAAIFALDAAADWDGFRDAARRFDVPSQNLVYADVEGNIGYQAPGRIPVRSAGDGTLPRAGWTSENGWSGYVDFDDLPSVYNPVDGYIVTANNAAVSADYPVMLTKDWDAGYRAARITELIRAHIDDGDPITSEDMSAIQADTHDAMADVLVPYLIDVIPAGDAADGRDLLAGWDHDDDADSAAAAYFNIVWKTLLEETFATKLPDASVPAGGGRWFQVVSALLEHPGSTWWSDADGGGRDEALADAMEKGWAEAVSLMGDDPSRWSWGRLHTLTIRNASFGESGIAVIERLFNRGPYQQGGGSSVVDATGWDASAGYEVNWVPSMRQVIDLSDFDASTWINLTGASGHAFHPNYVDQTPLWAAHETLPWAYTPDAVTDAAADTLVLRPVQADG